MQNHGRDCFKLLVLAAIWSGYAVLLKSVQKPFAGQLVEQAPRQLSKMAMHRQGGGGRAQL